jgi:hypothetical protein
MRLRFIGIEAAALAALLVFSNAPSLAKDLKQIDRLEALYADIKACLRLPSSPFAAEITLKFSLKRDGSLLGRPMITHSVLFGREAEQRAFVVGVLSAFNACLPLPITERLGGSIAGRSIYFRIKSVPRHFDI